MIANNKKAWYSIIVWPNGTLSKETVVSVKTYGALREAKPKAIIVYCLDPRFQEALAAFISGELKLSYGEFIPLVIAGGASVLARPDECEVDFCFAMGQIDFLFSHFPSVEEVILISHEDCGRVGEKEPQSKADLRSASANIKSHLSWPLSAIIETKLYYASFSAIEAVPLTKLQPVAVA